MFQFFSFFFWNLSLYLQTITSAAISSLFLDHLFILTVDYENLAFLLLFLLTSKTPSHAHTPFPPPSSQNGSLAHSA